MCGCYRVRGSTRGFSLVELLVVLAIMSVLATVAFPLAELAHRRQKEEELRDALRQIRTAIDAFKRAADEGRVSRPPGSSGYPPTLDVLVSGVEDARAGTGAQVYFLRRIPHDPFQPVSGGGSRGTTGSGWGLRSYASPADEPRPGEDVYDIYSLSAETGLNGIPYRQW